MKSRPILFSAPMVRALMEEIKTQTRRIVKPQPPTGHSFAGFTMSSTHTADEGKATWGAGDTSVFLNSAHRVRCPFGEPGDMLWVRETWAADACWNKTKAGEIPNGQRIWYDGINFPDRPQAVRGRWRPSIHMPRWASRIALEITGIRAERLLDISQADAIAEGIQRMPCDCAREGTTRPVCPHSEFGIHFKDYSESEPISCVRPSFSYMTLWESINGVGSWSANPWVWVIDFKLVEA